MFDVDRLDHHVTSRTFHQLFMDTYPALKANPHMTRLALFLLTSNWQDEAGAKVLPASYLATMAGKLREYEQKKYRTGEMLARFQEQVAPCVVRPWDYTGKKARRVRVEWPPAILEAWRQECRLSPHQRAAEPVRFVSGRRVRPQDDRERYRQQKRAAVTAWQVSQHPASQLALYLLHQPAGAFARMLNRNFQLAGAAVQALKKTKEGHGAHDEISGAQMYALNVLQGLDSYSMPIYKATPNSTRLFGVGQGVLTLPSSVRQALMSGAMEFDLASAQLAIVAQDWQVPRVQRFLAAEGSIWQALADGCGVDLNLSKPALKKAVYALIYGAQERRVRAELMATVEPEGDEQTSATLGIGESAADRFFSNPLIADLWEAREQQLVRLRVHGEAVDIFGAAHVVRSAKDARSVLAQLSQAKELDVMLAARPYLASHPDLQVMAWQHDGFTLHTSNASKWRTYERGIRAAVLAKICEHGYHTRLEGKLLQPRE